MTDDALKLALHAQGLRAKADILDRRVTDLRAAASSIERQADDLRRAADEIAPQ